MAGSDRQLERIERRILSRQRRAARFEPAVVVRIATAAYLHEQGIEPGGLRLIDEGGDGGGGGEGAALDPEGADFVISRGGPSRCSKAQ